MATNQTGIAITIKAWLPTGKGLDEQFAALSIVKNAHASGDYAPLLAAAKVEAVQTDSKTRRVDETVAPEQRNTFVVPEGHEAVRGEDGRATGETRPIAEPAATDDALAERPALDEPDGTVTEPAAQEEEHPMTKSLGRKPRAAA